MLAGTCAAPLRALQGISVYGGIGGIGGIGVCGHGSPTQYIPTAALAASQGDAEEIATDAAGVSGSAAVAHDKQAGPAPSRAAVAEGRFRRILGSGIG